MNDEFLYKNRPPVRKAFAVDLRQRLMTLETTPGGRVKGVNRMNPTTSHASVWRVALPALVMLSVLGSLFAFSEPVRAKTLEFIRVIAGFFVEEGSESPLAALPQDVTPAAQMTETSTAAVAAPTEYMIPTVPVSDLVANPPFQFGFPTWIPDGFTLDETAGIATTSSWVSIVWSNSEQAEIALLIEDEYTGYNIPAGVNSSEEIEINGAPALLIRGFWDAQHQWDPQRGISLDWEKDGRHYHLNYSERDSVHNEIAPIQGNMDEIIE